ncbi:MAG: hypothetical protein IT317_07250 [Anaerolineales bacterium]|nr:hypothetical protein [Anaerolineales bacterium]
MTHVVFSLPVSVEQIAAVIKQMSSDERQRLFELVPEIQYQLIGGRPPSTDSIDAHIDTLRGEVKRLLGETVITDDMPFLGGLTLRQYFDLPETERTQIWEAEAEADWNEASEREVDPDALIAR